MPKHFLFRQHIEDDEAITSVVHRHWLFGVKALWLPTLVIACVIALSAIVSFPHETIVVIGALVLIGIWWLRNFFDYFLDAWIITDHGIIDLNWHGWFHRESTRVLYSDVQGVSYEIKGILGTLFGFGDIAVEKISTGASISLSSVSFPRAVQTAIHRNMEAYVHTKNLKDAKTVQTILAEFVAGSLQRKELENEEE